VGTDPRSSEALGGREPALHLTIGPPPTRHSTAPVAGVRAADGGGVLGQHGSSVLL